MSFQKGLSGFLGKHHTEMKMSENSFMKGKFNENCPNWKGGIRKINNERNDSKYQWWVNQVKKRDNQICKLKDKKCFGYNIAHHIKGWSLYPELRYKTNNGITLCHFHHPRKRVDEQKLIPFFNSLVEVK